MKTYKIVTCLPIILLSISLLQALKAQNTDNTMVYVNFPQLSLCDIEPNRNAINFSLTAPTEAGLPVLANATNNTKWINYTSAVSGSTSQAITVQSNISTVGVELRVTASAVSGSGAGTRGTSTGIQTISPVARQIITGIRNCYTGNGSSNGHQLTYTIATGNSSQLVAASHTITIIYTMISQ